ncbi:hypothetical protein J6590_080338 [Homalodisca vitripennis]|nr:hypothetical protein J6590_080338 [Homalodisca vitripennis]
MSSTAQEGPGLRGVVESGTTTFLYMFITCLDHLSRELAFCCEVSRAMAVASRDVSSGLDQFNSKGVCQSISRIA